MSIKSIIKIFLPKLFLNWFRARKYKQICNACYNYDAERFNLYSNAYNKWNNPEKLIGQIIAEYHALEKGLTMPEMRLGFGQGLLCDLIGHCNLYATRFDRNNEQLLYAISIIGEYKEEHDKNNFKIEEKLLQSLISLLSEYKTIVPSKQLILTKAEYFKNTYSSFKDFSNSRHSLRNFSGEIDVELIERAITLAQNSPSACNRQPSRVYILQDKKIIEQVLEIQTGNRGFGHFADKLLVLTAELGLFFSLNERNDVYVNGGIYAMNLLYALHYYQIGACSLNWCSMPEQDLQLRKRCNIRPSETIIMIIACGGVPDEFKLALSPKNHYSNIIKII